MTKKQIFMWFFIAVFLLLFYLFYQVLKPFLNPLFWAAILALLIYPLHEKLTRLLRNKAGISSLVMTILTIGIIVVPLFLITATLAVEMFDVYKTAQSKGEFEKLSNILQKSKIIEMIKTNIPSSILQELETRFDVGSINLEAIALNGIGKTSKYLVGMFQNIARNLTSFIFNFGIMSFALFFFFRDGKRVYEEFMLLVPMNENEKLKIAKIFSDTIDGVIIGSLAIALIQGVLVGLIFWILGISYPVISGAISFILSILPAIGAAIVWAPVGIYLLFTGSVLTGIILLLFGAIVISTIDNIIRPLVIGGKVKLPTLFLLLSIFGGIQVFGFSGIILGPLLLALFISFIEIYKQIYRELA